MMSLNDDVYIVNQPIKLGWNFDELFIEAHEFLLDSSIDDELDGRSISQKKAKSISYVFSELTERYIKITDKKTAELDWRAAELASIRADGIPISVGVKN